MNLAKWVEQQMQSAAEAGQAVTKNDVLKALAERASVSLMTLAPVERGARMGNYGKARAISQATDWMVTIPELCDEFPDTVISRIIFQHQRERA